MRILGKIGKVKDGKVQKKDGDFEAAEKEVRSILQEVSRKLSVALMSSKEMLSDAQDAEHRESIAAAKEYVTKIQSALKTLK